MKKRTKRKRRSHKMPPVNPAAEVNLADLGWVGIARQGKSGGSMSARGHGKRNSRGRKP